jgi:hypothetical protein
VQQKDLVLRTGVNGRCLKLTSAGPLFKSLDGREMGLFVPLVPTIFSRGTQDEGYGDHDIAASFHGCAFQFLEAGLLYLVDKVVETSIDIDLLHSVYLALRLHRLLAEIGVGRLEHFSHIGNIIDRHPFRHLF